MADLKNPKLIYAKGLLFLLAGTIAAGLLVAETPSLKIALLLAISIWCFCRAYYFAFYVIEHYVDSSYKFAGLTSFIAYLIRRPPVAKDEPLAIAQSPDLSGHSRHRRE